MAWIDYKKADDMAPQSMIMECKSKHSSKRLQ